MANVVALITGASRGIGESIAMEFARAGVNVILNYNRHCLMAEKIADKIREKYDVIIVDNSQDEYLNNDISVANNYIPAEKIRNDDTTNNDMKYYVLKQMFPMRKKLKQW